jgi:enoyl-CoA hydratase/carnithine racemase
LNRPDTLNAVADELDEALWKAWADFNADDAADVAIATAAGKAFCSGADLKLCKEILNWRKRHIGINFL